MAAYLIRLVDDAPGNEGHHVADVERWPLNLVGHTYEVAQLKLLPVGTRACAATLSDAENVVRLVSRSSRS